MTPTPPQTERTYRPLWRRLAFFMVLFTLVPALTIALVLLNRNAEMIKTTSREVRLAATETVSVPLDLLVVDARQQLVAVGQALGDPTLSGELKMGLARTLVSSSHTIDHALIFDASGVYIDTIRRQELTWKPSTQPLSKDAMASSLALGAYVSSSLIEDRARVIVPLRTPEQEITGYVVSDVPIARMEDLLKATAAQKFAGEAGELFILSAGGNLLLSGSDNPTAVEISLGARAQELAKLPGVATSEEVGTSLVTFKPLEHAPWIVVANVPRAVAYAPLESLRMWVLVALALVVLLGVGFSIGFARGITRPINELMVQCRAIARREFTRRVEITSKDELGVLAATLNDSASELAASEHELLRQERIRHDLGRYLPHELVERVINKDDQVIDMVGSSEQVTVMFADVVGFTALCQSLTPEQSVTILNDLFTIITEIIFRHGGVVDKFIGDSVMAFWGAPQKNEEHAVDACSAAEEIISWLELGNVSWKEKFGVEIALAIGIHSGEAIVGNVGSSTRMTYTAIGDTVNLAARLESIARPNQILVTRHTANLVDELFELSYAGERQMPGYDEPLEIYEVTP